MILHAERKLGFSYLMKLSAPEVRQMFPPFRKVLIPFAYVSSKPEKKVREPGQESSDAYMRRGNCLELLSSMLTCLWS